MGALRAREDLNGQGTDVKFASAALSPVSAEAPSSSSSSSRISNVARFSRKLLTDYSGFNLLVTLLLFAETLLGALIIWKVPYTEIDWRAYMQEVEYFLDGERDYGKMKGDTGPLVYPAGFVYIFSGLRQLTDEGNDLLLGQVIFLVFYLFSLLLVCILYGRARLTPPWLILTLGLSRRVHSIFMLRLFNDGVAMMVLYLAMWAMLSNKWLAGTVLFSGAVSIKMNVLLFLPALLLLLVRALGPRRALGYLLVGVTVQALVGLPFLLHNWKSYLGRAFELSRVFFYEWTVNFKFLPEEIFLSKNLAAALLAGHLVTLAIFAQRWTRQCGGLIITAWRAVQDLVFGKQSQSAKYSVTTPAETVLTMFTSNFVGLCFARSIHYQFYSWYYFSLPFLLWQTKLPTALRFLLILAIEWAYNVFPATPMSSGVLQVAHVTILVALVASAPDLDVLRQRQVKTKDA